MKTQSVTTINTEQEKKYLKQTSSIVRVEAICFGVVLFSALTINAVEFANSCENELCSALSFVSLPLYAAAIGTAIAFVISLFKEIEQSDTPFTQKISEKLRKLSGAVLLGSASIALVLGTIQLIYSMTTEKSTSLSLAGIIGMGGLFFGIILQAVARVFTIGCRLQQESDETL